MPRSPSRWRTSRPIGFRLRFFRRDEWKGMKSPGMSSHRAAPFFVEGRESWASEYGPLLHNLPNIALRFDFLSSYVPALAAPGSRLRILDLGAAYGYYASVLQLHGHEIFAMEWAEDAAAAAVIRLGKDRVFHQSVAEPFPLPADSMDLIYAFDLVEHIDNETVERMLVSCERVLAPQGVLVISTDRKSTRLNSSHSQISYAVFCLKNTNACLHAISSGGSTSLAMARARRALTIHAPLSRPLSPGDVFNSWHDSITTTGVNVDTFRG